VFVHMDGGKHAAKTVEDPVFVHMDGGKKSARTVEDPVFVHMDGGKKSARTVEDPVFVHMDGGKHAAKSVRQRNKSFQEISSATGVATYTSVNSANATRSPCAPNAIHVYRNASRRLWYLFFCHKSSTQRRHKTIPSSEADNATHRGGVQISSGWVTIAS